MKGPNKQSNLKQRLVIKLLVPLFSIICQQFNQCIISGRRTSGFLAAYSNQGNLYAGPLHKWQSTFPLYIDFAAAINTHIKISDCPNGFEHLHNKCYKWLSSNWIDIHLQTCHNNRGHLLTISPNHPVSEMIAKTMMSFYNTNSVYAGTLNYLLLYVAVL